MSAGDKELSVDIRAPRLWFTAPMQEGETVMLDADAAHYLYSVMRRRPGDALRLFNAESGEFMATLSEIGKKTGMAQLAKRLREPVPEPDLWLGFAPLKSSRIDFIAEKATELGASRLIPVLTRNTIVNRVNTERLMAHAREAAEQCERLSVPEVAKPTPLANWLGDWPEDRILLMADESGEGLPATELLPMLKERKLALLTGPEGGFSREEHRLLDSRPFIRRLTLGPRILRAETAALAALACIQCLWGDWQAKPSFRAVN